MLDRHFVESFLRLNNLAAQLPDETIKKALRDADWSEEEAERAIKLLRNEDSQIQSVNTISRAAELLAPHKLRTSEDLSLLLGVDVIVDPRSVRAARARDHGHQTGKSILIYTTAFLAAIAFAVLVGWLFMYYGGIGPYHTPY